MLQNNNNIASCCKLAGIVGIIVPALYGSVREDNNAVLVVAVAQRNIHGRGDGDGTNKKIDGAGKDGISDCVADMGRLGVALRPQGERLGDPGVSLVVAVT